MADLNRPVNDGVLTRGVRGPVIPLYFGPILHYKNG